MVYSHYYQLDTINLNLIIFILLGKKLKSYYINHKKINNFARINISTSATAIHELHIEFSCLHKLIS